MRRVVVLRPGPGAHDTETRARALGLDPILRPLFEIVPLEWSAPDPASFDALLITSANTVRAAGDGLLQLRGLPVHAVGKATADTAREAGFDIASTGDAGVRRLLDSIAPDLRLLHLCGADRIATPDARQAITAIPVYEARTIETPDISGLKDTVVLLHSPRAARRLAELVQDRGEIRLAAISAAAAAAAGEGWAGVETAAEPTDEALLALAKRLCDSWSQP